MSIKQTRYGTWQVRWRDIDGNQRARNWRTQAQAEKWERQVRTDTDRGLPTAPRSRLSVGAWAQQWLEGNRRLQPSSRRMYQESWGHLAGELGRYPLHRLSAAHIDRALNAYVATGAAASSVARAFRMLRAMLNNAVERDLIMRSPLRGVKQPKQTKVEMRFLTADELERLANTIDPRYRSLILVAGWGGLRWGELAGLRVQDVDHSGMRVNVTGQLTTDGKARRQTKTGRSRWVDLPASVIADLPTTGDGYVWTQPAGGPLNHSNFRQRYFVPAVIKAGLGHLRIHDLRHTAVALAVAAGAHPAEIQAQLGHTSIKTTLDEYGGIFPSQAREVAERLEQVRSTARRLRAV